MRCCRFCGFRDDGKTRILKQGTVVRIKPDCWERKYEDIPVCEISEYVSRKNKRVLYNLKNIGELGWSEDVGDYWDDEFDVIQREEYDD